VTNRQTLGYALAAGSLQGALFGFVFCSQQIFVGIFHLGPYFPLAFASVAIGIAFAGFLNSQLVGRLGMRVISHGALTGFLVVSIIMVIAARWDLLSVWTFTGLAMCMMFSYGFMFANFTALAMEPQGHIAGTASSLYGSITTLLGIGIGYAVGQSFDGTLKPFTTSFLVCTLVSLAIVLIVERGRLFKASRQTTV
jgi:DHA1 family bicyclomycin/chloramphenicol resistance-like MFS transporter